MKKLTKEESEFFKQLQARPDGELPAAVFLTNRDFISLLKKRLEKEEDVSSVLNELEDFSGDQWGENFILCDEGWIEAKIEDGSEGVYMGVYFCMYLNHKTCRRRISTVKTLNTGLLAYKQIGMLAGAIICMGNDILHEHFWKTVALEEVGRIERLIKEGITFEDVAAEIERRNNGELVTTGGKITELDKICSIRILLHILNLWHVLPLVKSLLTEVEYMGGSVDRYIECLFPTTKTFTRYVRLLDIDIDMNKKSDGVGCVYGRYFANREV